MWIRVILFYMPIAFYFATLVGLQKETDWLTHSWTHNIYNPTWPTEWRQVRVLFFIHPILLSYSKYILTD